MGRGCVKAKQTKVVRQLKYDSPEMDLGRLRRELVGRSNEFDRGDYYFDREEWVLGADRDS